MSLLGIDIGTTGVKVAIFNKSGDILSSESIEYPLIHPAKGWAELDPELIWNNIKTIIKKVNQRIKKDRVTAFAISCQGEAIMPIDKNGQAIYNAIVTFDSRTKHQHEYWIREMGAKKIFEITGMPLHPMYSINKIMWIKQNRKDIFKRAYKFLCFEDYILTKFGLTPTIDYSLAARTMAFDIVNKVWSEEILQKAEINMELLSKARPSGEIVGEIDPSISCELGLDKGVVGVTGGHDQACGAFGSGIIEGNTALNATGTSDVIAAVLDRPLINEKMLQNNYPCYSHVVKDKYITVSFNLTGGLLLKWFRDKFCQEEKAIAKEKGKDVYDVITAGMHPEPVNTFILPHFVGSGTPSLDSSSKGIIIGLDLESDKSKIIRAILESNSYDLRLNIERLSECGINIDKIIAIGGGSRSSKWLKIKSEILNKKIETICNPEAASFGAALLSGVATGEYRSFRDAVSNTIRFDKSFEQKSNNEYNKRYAIYRDIYPNNKELLRRISKLTL